MTDRDRFLERCREALDGLAGRPAPSPAGPCPDDDALWAVASGEAPAAALRETLDHVSACARCVERLRLAREMVAVAHPDVTATPGRSTPGRFRTAVGGVVAIAAVITVFAVLAPWRASREAPDFRDGAAPVTTSTIPNDTILPRDAFTLGWEPGPEGSRYDVIAVDEAFRVELRVHGLTGPSWSVDADRLEDLPDGTALLWSVDVVAPDGSVRASPTFRVVVGAPSR